MDFIRYFDGQEEKLRAELSSTRATLTHSGNKGQRAEAAFRDFLSDHLPRSMEVGHGETVDRTGAMAGSRGGYHQIDVLVISDSHPRFGKIEEPSTYFIEGVNAGGEVKSNLKLSHIEPAFNQARKFKKLNQVLGAGDLCFSNESDARRFLEKRPYFLFAYESETPLDSIIGRLLELENSRDCGSEDHFDAIFIMGQGAAINLGDGGSSFVMKSADGKNTVGWSKAKGSSLMTLITWLSIVMPSVVKLSPILANYLVEAKK